MLNKLVVKVRHSTQKEEKTVDGNMEYDIKHAKVSKMKNYKRWTTNNNTFKFMNINWQVYYNRWNELNIKL